MHWILILILVGPDSRWTGYTYPQRFAPQKQCEVYGAGMVDGDGDNEHAVCAPISTK